MGDTLEEPPAWVLLVLPGVEGPAGVRLTEHQAIHRDLVGCLHHPLALVEQEDTDVVLCPLREAVKIEKKSVEFSNLSVENSTLLFLDCIRSFPASFLKSVENSTLFFSILTAFLTHPIREIERIDQIVLMLGAILCIECRISYCIFVLATVL